MTRSRGLVLALVLVATVAACGRGDHRRSRAPDGASNRESHTAADSVWSVGKARYDAGAYDSAVALWTAGLRLTRQSADSGGQARMLTWLGHAFRLLQTLFKLRAAYRPRALWLSQEAAAVLNVAPRTFADKCARCRA